MSQNDTSIIEELLLTIKRLESKVDSLQTQMAELTTPGNDSVGEWLTIDELSQYLPSHPSESTIRRMISAKEFPTYKVGKRVTVKKSEIDDWLLASKKKSSREILDTASLHIDTRKAIRPAPWRQKSA